jgi:hypothetical protein
LRPASSGDVAFNSPSLNAVLPLCEELEEGGQPLDHLARLLATDRPPITGTEKRDGFVDKRVALPLRLRRGGRL